MHCLNYELATLEPGETAMETVEIASDRVQVLRHFNPDFDRAELRSYPVQPAPAAYSRGIP